MPIGVGARESSEYLPEELCFTLWNELGSVTKMCNALIERGIKHPETGKSPSRRGAEVAAIRWMGKNILEARDRIRISGVGGDWVDDLSAYLVWLINRNYHIMGRNDFDAFMKDALKIAEHHMDDDEFVTFVNLMQDVEYIEILESSLRHMGYDFEDEE